jgi:hypothetical protein
MHQFMNKMQNMKALQALCALLFLLFLPVFITAQDGRALPHKELQKYLPASVKGYTAEEGSNGSTINMGDQVFATVEQNYVKDDTYLKITLFDYSQASALFEQSSMMWSDGLSIQNDEGYERSARFSQKDVRGWETFDSEDQLAEIYIGVKKRFIIIISAEGQKDTQFVLSLAEPIINQLIAL